MLYESLYVRRYDYFVVHGLCSRCARVWEDRHSCVVLFAWKVCGGANEGCPNFAVGYSSVLCLAGGCLCGGGDVVLWCLFVTAVGVR